MARVISCKSNAVANSELSARKRAFWVAPLALGPAGTDGVLWRRLNHLFAAKDHSWGFRNVREALGAMIGRLVRDKSRVATGECANALVKELAEMRVALAQAQARSEERRIALESHVQDVGLMRIQLRMRATRIATLQDASDDGSAQMRAALAQAQARSEERRIALESHAQEVGLMRIQLRVRAARIAALEKEVSDLGGALARRTEQIGAANSDAPLLNDTIAPLTATVAERHASIAALKAMQLAEHETLASRHSDLTRKIAETEFQRKNLGALGAALAAANARLVEEEAAAHVALELRDSMEAAIGEQRLRIAQLEAELAGVVRDRDASVATAAAVQAEHLEQGARLATASARVLELEAAALDQVHAIAALQEEPRLSRARARDLEDDLHAAEDSIHQLERDLHLERARLAEGEAAARAALELRNSMEAAIGEQRQRIARLEVELAGVVRERGASVAAVQAEHLEQGARLATASARVLELEAAALDQVHTSSSLHEEPRESRERARDSEGDLHAAEVSVDRIEADLHIRGARKKVAMARDNSSGTSRMPEVVAESAAPLFIHTGKSEVVHVLGRKTTIGRTAENDLQIDAKYISRHHAVILAGATHAIIEDLKSTNGVTVNGRRVVRQTLKDGDIVLIGKEPFRFAVRSGAEQR